MHGFSSRDQIGTCCWAWCRECLSTTLYMAALALQCVASCCLLVTTSKHARSPTCVLCCAIFKKTPHVHVPVITQCLLYTTPNFITWRYITPGIWTTVWTCFLDRTGITLYRSFWVQSIMWSCYYVYLVHTTLTISFDIKGPQTTCSLIHTELDTV